MVLLRVLAVEIWAVYRMLGADGERNKDYRWRCRGCKRMFTVRTGTVFEESRLPLRVWVYAFLACMRQQEGHQRAATLPRDGDHS